MCKLFTVKVLNALSEGLSGTQTHQDVSSQTLQPCIAFASYRDGDMEIYAMEKDGTNQTNLTNNPADDWSPSWSPDGTKIAFFSDRNSGGIYTMNADGSNVSLITHHNFAGDSILSWSPSGEHIAYCYDDKLYIVASNGEYLQQISFSEIVGISCVDLHYYLAWAPDGSRLAFLGETAYSQESILVVDADGSGMIDVTPFWEAGSYPTWSRDGSKIAFAGECDPGLRPEGCPNYSLDLYVVEASGENHQMILSDFPWIGSGVSWSPDGTKLVFVACDDEIENCDLYSVNPDGSDLTRLTQYSGISSYSNIIWSPDSKIIVFESLYRNGEIYGINIDGTGQVNLTDNIFWDILPTWNPVCLSIP